MEKIWVFALMNNWFLNEFTEYPTNMCIFNDKLTRSGRNAYYAKCHSCFISLPSLSLETWGKRGHWVAWSNLLLLNVNFHQTNQNHHHHQTLIKKETNKQTLTFIQAAEWCNAVGEISAYSKRCWRYWVWEKVAGWKVQFPVIQLGPWSLGTK